MALVGRESRCGLGTRVALEAVRRHGGLEEVGSRHECFGVRVLYVVVEREEGKGLPDVMVGVEG